MALGARGGYQRSNLHRAAHGLVVSIWQAGAGCWMRVAAQRRVPTTFAEMVLFLGLWCDADVSTGPRVERNGGNEAGPAMTIPWVREDRCVNPSGVFICELIMFTKITN